MALLFGIAAIEEFSPLRGGKSPAPDLFRQRNQRVLHSGQMRLGGGEFPIFESCGQSGSPGIHFDIAHSRPIVVLIERRGVEPVLENMPAALQPAVELHGPPSVHTAEQAGESIRIGRREDEVNVIVHQTIRVDQYLFLLGKQGEVREIFALVEAAAEDLHVANTTGDHVMSYIFQDEARCPSHKESSRGRSGSCKPALSQK